LFGREERVEGQRKEGALILPVICRDGVVETSALDFTAQGSADGVGGDTVVGVVAVCSETVERWEGWGLLGIE
jgi:hypothetical protein